MGAVVEFEAGLLEPTVRSMPFKNKLIFRPLISKLEFLSEHSLTPDQGLRPWTFTRPRNGAASRYRFAFDLASVSTVHSAQFGGVAPSLWSFPKPDWWSNIVG